jgi:hypothetical protein
MQGKSHFGEAMNKLTPENQKIVDEALALGLSYPATALAIQNATAQKCAAIVRKAEDGCAEADIREAFGLAPESEG